jgi:methyltransferase (TIGR00027 family)
VLAAKEISMPIEPGPVATARAASQTALGAAACRRRATQHRYRFCDDPWAGALAGADGEAVLDDILQASPGVYPPLDMLVGLRAGYVDAHVIKETGAASGFRQVVILGAGLDTRAARLARQGVTYYEVDHPESQADKLRRLRALPGYPIDAAQYVPCDFEHADPIERLQISGLRAEEPALFILEGVAHYLTEAMLRKTLEPIARRCHPRSTVLFDYLGNGVAVEEHGAELEVDRNEPLLWTSDNPLTLLRDLGFLHVRTTPFDQLFVSMTGERCPPRGFIHTCHFARAAVEAPAPTYLW